MQKKSYLLFERYLHQATGSVSAYQLHAAVHLARATISGNLSNTETHSCHPLAEVTTLLQAHR